jgi:CRP-like cAMP-binding protein
METNASIPGIARLEFTEGDLIAKQGDFGISIYEIISGKVGIFVSTEEGDARVATIEKGNLIGEMGFIAGDAEPRKASYRALSDCVLEAWHPAALKQEYQSLPLILRQIADQSLQRLRKVDSMIASLKEKLGDGAEDELRPLKPEDKRKAYRKSVDIDCQYRPVNSHPKTQLLGRLEDISQGGMKMVAQAGNALQYSHQEGEELIITAQLTPNQRIEVSCRIVNASLDKGKGIVNLGLVFSNMTMEDKKRLGFFLMP